MPSIAGQQRISLELTNLTFLAAGKSGIVYGIDDARVLKQYYDQESEDALVEQRAFARLGSHANIIECLRTTDDGYAVLERGTPIHQLLQNTPDISPESLDKKFQWAKDAALGLEYLHNNNILHADVGCHNMVIVGDRLKLIDFEGCSIDGSEATSCYHWFSYRDAKSPISVQTDIFAYGCALYEIMSGQHPYHELALEQNRRELVRSLYANNQFPDTTNLPFSNVINACWMGNFNSVGEVLAALEAEYLTTV